MIQTVGFSRGAARTALRLISVIAILSLLSITSTPTSRAMSLSQAGEAAASSAGPRAEAAWYPDPHPILTDARVRQAMAYCTDKVGLVTSVYPLLSTAEKQSLVLNSMIPNDHWAYAGDANLTIYPYNPAAGIALLEQAGWTLQSGATYRTNALGEELAIKFTTTLAPFRQTWAEEWEAQMQACGIRIVRFHTNASWWFGNTTGLTRRDFELGAYAWVHEQYPGGRTLWACDQIPTPENGWTGQNYMGWCNPTADAAILTASATLDHDQQVTAYRQLQQAYTTDVPALPLFQRMAVLAADSNLNGFDPDPGDALYTYNAGAWTISGSNTITHGITQEPGTLFGLVDDNLVTLLALDLIGAGRSYTTLGYESQTRWLVALPTLDNGRAVNNTVTANQGDRVVNALGQIEELQPGVLVRNASGQELTYGGGPLQMKQLVVQYEYRSDLLWPDGQAIQAEDIQLGYDIDCDPATGAVSYDTCNRTVSYTVSGRTATQTLLPGDQSPSYSTRDFHVYPAHRIVSGGRRLDQVPASEWVSLPEVTRTPWGFGPYQLVSWAPGSRISLTAHPHWFGGTPATPNYALRIIAQEDAVAELINGGVDLLGSDALITVDQVMLDAETAGTIEISVLPSPTWEHTDMNFSAQPPPNGVLNDVRVRRAMAYCTDRYALAQTAYPSLSNPEINALLMDSFFPDAHWGYVQPSTLYPFSPSTGRALLEQAGWTLQPDADFRTNTGGEELAFKYTTTTSAMRLAVGELWESQMADCGIRIERLHAAAGWWFGDTTGLARRDFDIGEFAWIWNRDSSDTLSGMYAVDAIPSAANGWQGQNLLGWYDPAASANAHLGDNLGLSLAQRRDYYAIVQERFASEVPSIPLFEHNGLPGTWEHIDFNMTSLPQLYLPVTRK